MVTATPTRSAKSFHPCARFNSPMALLHISTGLRRPRIASCSVWDWRVRFTDVPRLPEDE
jgi:hypothetical protein